MQKLDIKEIVNLIKRGETFEAESIDSSFSIKINKYVPYCCFAIHAGTEMRLDLRKKVALDDFNRWYEEDPHTADFIESLPITMIGMDSRYEYDLNRDPSTCVYDEVWGKKVWKQKLTVKEKAKSLKKHNGFYTVVNALMDQLVTKFGAVAVYDVHSYNYKRWDRPVPLFNIGSERVNEKFDHYVDHWAEVLSEIELPDIINETAVNDVFYGRGYLLEYITREFEAALVLATEIKKVYCNEESGEAYHNIITTLKQSFKEAILKNAQLFSENKTTWAQTNSAYLLDKKADKDIYKVDAGLYKVLKSFELLSNINPLNTNVEFKKFVKSNFTEPPRFKYAPVKINPFEVKSNLSRLPLNQITDISVRNLYESVIGSYFDKVDLLASLNTKKFLYNSLRYFGRPSKKDLLNAQYILHLPDIPTEPKRAPHLSIEEIVEHFKKAVSKYGFDCRIELSNKVISQVMVLNTKKKVLIKPDAKVTEKEVLALLEHEIGVHMVTTHNSNLQRLKVFNIGLPVNTLTQEGLAILSEYLSGNISLKRLKRLALRVVITDMMCSGADFIECFHVLVNNYKVSESDAYIIVTRIFRGGGFTKDYVYLSGFVKIWKLWKAHQNLDPLLVGKTSVDYYSTIEEMMHRDMVMKPQYRTQSFLSPSLQKNDDLYEYIISGLK